MKTKQLIEENKIKNYLEASEYLPFGEKLIKYLNGIFGERPFFEEKGKITRHELSILKWKKHLLNNFYKILFTSLNFDELNIGTIESKKVTSDYLNNVLASKLTDDEKLEMTKNYNIYVTKSFFKKFPYLENDRNIVSKFADSLYTLTALLATQRDFHKKAEEVFKLRSLSKSSSEFLPNVRTDEENLIFKIRKVKSDLSKKGDKITLTNIAELFGLPITTLKSQLDKHHIDWRTV